MILSEMRYFENCIYEAIHILRNHKEGGGFRNDYANVIFVLSSVEFDYGKGRGYRNRKKMIT